MHESNIAKQLQCPHCLATQPADDVMAFSKGEADCVDCGRRSGQMTYDNYYKALRETRRRIFRS